MVDKYWLKVAEDLFVIRAEGLEDFRAVVGAKTSRAAKLDIKADIDSEGVEKFLTMNLAGYGHASIGEMSFPTVHHRGIGWVSAWLLEDDPLFIGQEISTRAVDVRKLPKGDQVCYDAPTGLDKYNEYFWNLFQELDDKNDLSRGYKFDNIRWAMPGTSRVGVTYMMNTRAAMRHLERLESVPFISECVDNFYKGIEACAPYVYKSLRKGKRRAYSRWTDIENIDISRSSLDFDSSIEIEAPLSLEEGLKRTASVSGRSEKDYLDPEFNSLGMFKFNLTCSVAAARDWHRHRPMMPWKIKLVLDNNIPFVAPWYDLGEYESEVNKMIAEGYGKTRNISSLDKLYSLPYGATVNIEGWGTLPYLLYMLELRAAAGGSNFEYANHAKAGLRKLISILGKDFVKKHSIDRVLKIKD